MDPNGVVFKVDDRSGFMDEDGYTMDEVASDSKSIWLTVDGDPTTCGWVSLEGLRVTRL